jgi:hypothetical protein
MASSSESAIAIPKSILKLTSSLEKSPSEYSLNEIISVMSQHHDVLAVQLCSGCSITLSECKIVSIQLPYTQAVSITSLFSFRGSNQQKVTWIQELISILVSIFYSKVDSDIQKTVVPVSVVPLANTLAITWFLSGECLFWLDTTFGVTQFDEFIRIFEITDKDCSLGYCNCIFSHGDDEDVYFLKELD